jgi:hypothetical protein
MRYIKKFEKLNHVLNYKKGDIVIPIETENGKNPKDSYSIIVDVRGGNMGDYMVSTYNIYTGKQLEGPWPIFDYEIVRKLTPEEISKIPVIMQNKFNL